MTHPRVLFLILVAVFSANQSWAQQPSDEVPPSIEALRHGASSKTEFTLDHSMLVLASKLDANNEDLRRVIAGVSQPIIRLPIRAKDSIERDLSR